MAIEAPTNCWTKAEAKIAEALANSAAFQAIVEMPDAATAAAKVFGEQLDEPLDGNTYTKDELANLLAYGQVYSAQDEPYGVVRTNTNTLWPFGTAIVFVERLVRESERAGDDVPQSTERKWKNWCGDMIDEIPEWLENETGPHVRSIVVTDGPGYNAKDRWQSKGMWQGIELTIEWGIVER